MNIPKVFDDLPESVQEEAELAVIGTRSDEDHWGYDAAEAVFDVLRKHFAAAPAAPVSDEPCRIKEHDGAFKCYTHNKTWGAVTNSDVPCSKPVSDGEGETPETRALCQRLVEAVTRGTLGEQRAAAVSMRDRLVSLERQRNELRQDLNDARNGWESATEEVRSLEEKSRLDLEHYEMLCKDKDAAIAELERQRNELRDTNEQLRADLHGMQDGSLLRDIRARMDELRERHYLLQLVVTEYHNGRCYVCGWPLKASDKDGCVPGNCSFRPSEQDIQYHGWKCRMEELSRIQKSLPPVPKGDNK